MLAVPCQSRVLSCLQLVGVRLHTPVEGPAFVFLDGDQGDVSCPARHGGSGTSVDTCVDTCIDTGVDTCVDTYTGG